MHMLGDIRHHLSVGAFSLKQSIQTQIEYPTYLLGWLLSNPLQYFFGILLLKVLVDRFQPLAGWTYPELAFLYGLGLLSHGLQVVFTISFWNIEYFITAGEFDRMLLRPLNRLWQLTIYYFNFIGLTDLIPAITIFIYACGAVHFQWTLASAGRVMLVLIGATLLRSGVYLAIASMAFWTGRSGPLVETTVMLAERGTLYPLSVYPFGMQIVLTFLVPFGFIAFYPSCDFLHKPSGLPLACAFWTPCAGLLVFALGAALFKRGFRRYESAGS